MRIVLSLAIVSMCRERACLISEGSRVAIICTLIEVLSWNENLVTQYCEQVCVGWKAAQVIGARLKM